MMVHEFKNNKEKNLEPVHRAVFHLASQVAMLIHWQHMAAPSNCAACLVLSLVRKNMLLHNHNPPPSTQLQAYRTATGSVQCHSPSVQLIHIYVAHGSGQETAATAKVLGNDKRLLKVPT